MTNAEDAAATLRRTDALAGQQGGSGTLGDPTAACPLTPTWRIEVEVVDEAGAPLSGVAVELVRADGAGLQTRTGAAGLACFAGLEDDGLKVGLFELDAAAWALVASIPLDEPRGGAPPGWTALVRSADAPQLHSVVQGDCISSIAHAYGFFPATLWDHPTNSRLREGRRDPNILFAGDSVHIPAKSSAQVPVGLGQRHRVRRRGIPEVLRIRFLDADREPRPGVIYLIDLETATGAPIATREGSTDGAGFLTEAIPPDATRAVVRLDPGAGEHRYTFDLGHVDPIDEVSGVQARLASLRYYGGAVDGVLGEQTAGAIRQFQALHGLPETGRLDGPFLDALTREFGS